MELYAFDTRSYPEGVNYVYTCFQIDFIEICIVNELCMTCFQIAFIEIHDIVVKHIFAASDIITTEAILLHICRRNLSIRELMPF